jgi:hypothetical protein
LESAGELAQPDRSKSRVRASAAFILLQLGS